jgi:non-homologous end joining protein Ku
LGLRLEFDEVRDEDAYLGSSDDDTADAEMIPLVQQLIRQQTRHWDGKMDADAVQERLLEIIALKKKALRKAENPGRVCVTTNAAKATLQKSPNKKP